MPLEPGRRLGSFEVVSPLGAGGMGEVYRARDQRLGREVALKVLPETFSRDPQRLARFEREARVLAALNHLYECCADFSPNGRWIAYVSGESGRDQIYVRPYPGPGRKYPVSAEGGGAPVWAAGGRELFFRNGGKLMAVDVTTSPGFSAGPPHPISDASFEWGYDVRWG